MFQNHSKFRIYSSIAFAVCIVAIVAGMFVAWRSESSADLHNFSNSCIYLREGWELSEDGGRRNVSLPHDIRTASPFVISLDLPSAGGTEGGDYAVMLAPYYMEVEAALNGQAFYEYSAGQDSLIQTVGTPRLMIELPHGWQGKNLSLRFQPKMGSINYFINAPLLGRPADILLSTVKRDVGNLILCTVLLFSGVLITAAHFLLHKKVADEPDYPLLWIGVFALLSSAYVFCQIVSVRMVIQNFYGLYLMEYGSMALLPLPALMLVLQSANVRHVPLFRLAVDLVLANFVFQVFLRLLGIAEFRQMAFITHGVLCFDMIIIMISLILTNGKENRRKWQFLASLVPLVLGGAVDLFRFYFLPGETVIYGVKAGLTLFILMEAYFFMRDYMNSYADSLQITVYKQMAYKDGLTGLHNRTAYEEKLDALRKDIRPYLPVWCISVDINNLKVVNDHQGHQAGDRLICEMAGQLKRLVGRGDEACIYRIGGDEFIILLFRWEERRVRELEHGLHGLIGRNGLEFALGVAQYNQNEDSGIENMLSRADARMYQDKAVRKGKE